MNRKREYDRKRYLRIKKEREASKPEDPIRKLSVADCAYIAGLIDGEGSLHMQYKRRTKQYPTMYPELRIAMTSRGVLEWFARTVKTAVVQKHNHTGLREHPNHKPAWCVGLTGRRLQLLCKRTMPYMKVKHKHAKLILSFPINIRRTPLKYIPEEIHRRRFEIRKELVVLNRRGVQPCVS